MKPAHQQEGSRRARQVDHPAIPYVNRLLRRVEGSISLGQGTVSYPPPEDALKKSLMCMEQPNEHKYGRIRGLGLLVHRLEKKLKRANGVTLDRQKIYVTAGANMAFNTLLMAIADPGDEIILINPCYFNHKMSIEMNGCRAALVDSDEDCRPDIGAISKAISKKTRAVVSISPNNPSGRVYSKEALTAINKLCAKHGIYHISDEAYEDFVYEERSHFSPGSLSGAGQHTLSLFSFSKSYGMASWRVGYMVIPDKLRAAVEKIQDTILICAPVISQHLAAECLLHYADYPKRNMAAIKKNRSLFLARLSQLELIKQPLVSEGAFYIYANVKKRVDDYRLITQLIKQHKVGLIPGSAFNSVDTHLRISFGALSEQDADLGLRRLLEGLRQLLSS